MNYQDKFDQQMNKKTLPKAEEVVINPESIAEKMLVRDLERPYKARRDNPSLSARVFRMDAREAENARKHAAKIRGEGKCAK